MPDIKAALYGLLSTTPSVTSLVGDRVYTDWIPQDTARPYVVINRIDSQDFAPNMATATDNLNSTVQLDVWGDSSIEVEAITDTLRPLLDGYRGVMTADFVYSSRMNSLFDSSAFSDDGTESPKSRSTMTFEFWHI